MLKQKSDRFLNAVWQKPVDKTPIWMMRQAGRYLPEYRKVRAKAGSFMTLCQHPELATEVTLQPLNRYALDAAIIFSDILVIPDALGLGLGFKEGEGPYFAHPLDSEKAIHALPALDPALLSYVYEAIKLVKQELAGRIPLIGFTGSPWTLAAYMVQGRSKVGFDKALKLIAETPALAHQLLNHLAKAVALHLHEQIKAGAETVMIFDTWGGILPEGDYQTFSLRYIKQVIETLAKHYNNSIPVILFTKGGSAWLPQMMETGCQVIGVDWTISMQDARRQTGDKVALQGNMHPGCLLTSPAAIRTEVANILESFGKGSGHIFNLGHGITPDVPPEHVTVLVEAVHELSVAYHENEV